MAPSHARRSRFSYVPLTLAGWQLRQTWLLLLIVGAGVVAAVIIVCAVPLYSQISETAELQGALRVGSGANDTLIAQSVTQKMAAGNIQYMQLGLNSLVHDALGSFVTGQTQFSIEMDDLTMLLPNRTRAGRVSYGVTGDILDIIGIAPSQAKSHVDLLGGQVPGSTINPLTIAISEGMAESLHLTLGSSLAIQVSFSSDTGEAGGNPYLNLRVSGIFRPTADAYWHGRSLDCSKYGLHNELCSVLVDNNSFINALSYAQGTVLNQYSSVEQQHILLSSQAVLSWYYRVDPARVTLANVSTLTEGVNTLAAAMSGFDSPPYLTQSSLTDPTTPIINQFTNRSTIVQIPITSLSLLIVGLTLFFVITMSDILVERQAEAIAVLRSRGASRRQLFGALLMQHAGICLVALIVGPLAAVVVVPLFSLATLPRADTGAIAALGGTLPSVFQIIIVPTIVVIGVALLAMAFATVMAIQREVLSWRREAARSANRPLWARLNADVVAAVIAVTGFGLSLYEARPGVLDERVRVLVLPPLTLAGVVFLLIGLSLLLLRVFPIILRGGSKLAQRSRGASSMLAVAQMARAPRQSLRMTMLLAFSVAFAIFALVFNATQTQRILDVANYEVGADFNGQLSSANTLTSSAPYRHLPGVLSATIGYSSLPTVIQGEQSVSVQLFAIEADTFAHTFIWPAQDSTQPISSLMRTLVEQRANALNAGQLPAIVDSAAWETLHLSPGAVFSMNDGSNYNINCRVIAEVQRIPTVNDSVLATGTSDFAAAGGVLVDYQSYAVLSQKLNEQTIQPNNVWLKTSDNPAQLALVRQAITSGPLALGNVNDRRAIISNLSSDPLYLDLAGLLVIGTVIAILLALVGNLIASWLSVRSRLTSFAVLRALGTAHKELVGILGWEQAVVYAIALLLGVVFGVLLSVLALPSLIFTNIAVSGFSGSINNGQYYVLQTIPPVRIIIPPSLGIVLALVTAICVAALVMMVRIATRPSLSQTLRLNED